MSRQVDVARSPAGPTSRRGLRAPAGRTGRALGGSTARLVMGLQRSAGNGAVSGAIAGRPGTAATDREIDETPGPPRRTARATLPVPQGVRHPVADLARDPSARFRVPSFAVLSSEYAALVSQGVPAQAIIDRVSWLLARMRTEGRLPAGTSISAVLARIFPASGGMDETAFNSVFRADELTQVYQSVLAAETTVRGPDRTLLDQTLAHAGSVVARAAANSVGMAQVFGSQAAVATRQYAGIEASLARTRSDLDSHVTTDYAGESDEVGSGGFAVHREQRMHLMLDVVRRADRNEAAATVLHEAAHLADLSITDHVYYGSAGYIEATEAEKVTNAAHYEELPRRIMGTSRYPRRTFRPGITASGRPMTRDETARAEAVDHLRKAWAASLTEHEEVRGTRAAQEQGTVRRPLPNRVRLREASKRLGLSLHLRPVADTWVTVLDVTISESTVRAISTMGSLVGTVPLPPGRSAMSEREIRDALVRAAITRYGQFHPDTAHAEAILDWFVARY